MYTVIKSKETMKDLYFSNKLSTELEHIEIK